MKKFFPFVLLILAAIYSNPTNSQCTPISSTYTVSNRSVTAPASTTFSVTATGTSITYKWEYSTNNGSTWNNATGTPYSGGTTSTLTINPTAVSMSGYRYRCSLFNNCTAIASTNWAALTVTTSTCANLTPYQPSGWDSKIILSTATGTNTSASTFSNDQTIYLDWAALNSGTCNITSTFYSKLYLDGVLLVTYNTAGLNSTFYTSVSDVAIGPLAAGSHTFEIVVDANNNVTETNESDNSYSRTIAVTSSACANLAPWQPTGWSDQIVLSTVTGTTTSASTFSDNQTIYLDWAVGNFGTCNISQSFTTKIYIDGVLYSGSTTAGLNNNFFTSQLDLNIGPLSAGSHTFQVVTDANSNVIETNESDNSYSRTITVVTSTCTPASLTTAFNGVKTINTDLFQPNNYRLKDNCQVATIRVRDWNSLTATPNNPIEITSPTNSWTSTTQRFGGSVLWATKQAYNYYKNVHSRPSYDSINGQIEAFVNAVFTNDNGSLYTDNAFMINNFMYVGLGSSNTLSNSFCPLDIIAHEYTHAVTGSSARLEYHDESGALNESFSDIFGEVVENYVLGNIDWLHADDRTSGAYRSLSNPKAFGHPNTYLSTNAAGPWYIGTGDYGGVHTNSGVQNFWFYLLAEGGSGTNDNGYVYNVTGIGLTKASAIAYRNLTVSLKNKPYSKYSDAKMGSIDAANILYGTGSPEAIAVENAWCAVGVGTCTPTCFTPAVVTVNGGGTQCNSATLTASGGNGGTIYWQNTTNNGTSMTTQSTNRTVTSSGTYYFRAVNNCGVWGPQGSAVVTISSSGNFWNGTVSTAWENPANWSCGTVPDANTKVYINSGTPNSPVITSLATCKSINVAQGASNKGNYRL